MLTQCDFLESGKVHPTVCTQNTLNGDPIKRLEFRSWYESKDTGKMEEECFGMVAEWQTKQLNSFVDFLDRKSEE